MPWECSHAEESSALEEGRARIGALSRLRDEVFAFDRAALNPSTRSAQKIARSSASNTSAVSTVKFVVVPSGP